MYVGPYYYIHLDYILMLDFVKRVWRRKAHITLNNEGKKTWINFDMIKWIMIDVLTCKIDNG